jgi:arabinose-5-phosphate isomerase
MTTSTPHAAGGKLNPSDQLRLASEIIRLQGEALQSVAQRLGSEFCRAVELVFDCRGSVIVSGMGKAGLIGQKISATLSSTGTRAHFLHPGEAVHGDLGRIHQDDLLLILSHSGETEEVVRLLPSLAHFGVPLVAITGRRHSQLGRAATVVIDLGPLQEGGPLGLAPSTSTTAMLATGDALALVVAQMRSFGREDFARFHPAGSLGRQLSRVDDHMRVLAECRVAPATRSVREVYVQAPRGGRRSGAIMLTDAAGRLVGVFTDSDLARLLESRRDAAIDAPVAEVMSALPCTVRSGTMMVDAVAVMAEKKISELPVVDAQGRPVGMVDITDVVGLLPAQAAAAEPPAVRPNVLTLPGPHFAFQPQHDAP